MKLDKLRPKPDQRMMITGASGSGKTTLARHLLYPYKEVLVIDPKCTYGGKEGEAGFRMVRTPGQLSRLRASVKKIQYRPDVEYQNVKGYDAVYEWAYRRGGIMVYTDETFQTMHGSHSPDYQRACITCGRELGVGMIFSSQRPSGIDLRVFTEAEVLAMFELRYGSDVKRMAELMGDEVKAPLEPFHFYFWRAGMRHPSVHILNLGAKGSK